MKKRSQLYDYLEKSGVLENGSREDINKAKKKYWSLVRKEWRKQQRKECKCYTVFLTKTEKRDIDRAVENRMTNTTQFIKTSALQKARNSSGVDKKVLGQIREMFFDTYIEVEKIEDISEQILNSFIELEQQVLNLLQH